MQSENLLTTAAAAKFLSVSQAFLERDRWAGARIPFIKVGSRAVRYRMADLEQYVVARRSSAPPSTSCADGAVNAARRTRS
jgi:hypothetical protein